MTLKACLFKVSRPSLVQSLHQIYAASYNKHPIYVQSTILGTKHVIKFECWALSVISEAEVMQDRRKYQRALL
jgi:hypothetical protein